MTDSANGFLSLNTDLTFQSPEKIQDGSINYVSFKPQSIGAYGPNTTVDFRLRSTNEFVVLERSYMKFRLTETGAAGAATGGTILSSMGAQAVISQVQDTVSGLQLPVIKNYNLQQSLKLNTDTTTRKAVTTVTEAFGGGISGTSTFASKTFCIPVPTSLASASKIIPLAVLNGGWNITLQLEQYARVFTNGNPANSYSVDQLEIVCCMLKPDDKYLSELSAAMSRQGSLKIPLQLVKNITATLAATNTQSVRIPSGYLSSLNSITSVIRQVANVGTGTNTTAHDTFVTNTSALQEYYFMVNSQRYPKNKAIVCQDPENLLQLLSSFNSKYSELTPFTSTNAFTHFSFESNGGMASGIAINDGYVNIETTFASTPAQGDVLDCFLEYSAVLVIDMNSVDLIIDV